MLTVERGAAELGACGACGGGGQRETGARPAYGVGARLPRAVRTAPCAGTGTPRRLPGAAWASGEAGERRVVLPVDQPSVAGSTAMRRIIHSDSHWTEPSSVRRALGKRRRKPRSAICASSRASEAPMQ